MALTLTVGTNTWVTLAEAETYFEGRLAADNWDACADAKKNKALVSAYRDLTGCGIYTFPSTITDAIKNAQCEQALFLLNDEDGIDARASLASQGVASSKVVGETYRDGAPALPAISQRASALLSDYDSSTASSAKVYEVYREEEDEETL